MRGRRAGKVRLQPTQFIVSMQAPLTVLEGAALESKTFTIPLTRAGNLGYTGSVDWAVTPSGTQPATTADFGGSFPSGTITFSEQQLTASINLQIYGNDIPDDDRTFTITLSNVQTSGGSGLAMIAVPATICTIVDEDTPEAANATYNGSDAIYSNIITTYGTG